MKEVPNQKAKLMGSVSVSRATDGTPPRKEVKMKLSTINQIVEAILSQTKSDIKLVHEDVREATFKRMANEATIILKTAMICEARGIDEAMKYYNGTHTEDEYKELEIEQEKWDGMSEEERREYFNDCASVIVDDYEIGDYGTDESEPLVVEEL